MTHRRSLRAATCGLLITAATSCSSAEAPTWRDTLLEDLSAEALFPTSQPNELAFIFVNEEDGVAVSAFTGVNSPAVRICAGTREVCERLEALDQHQVLREGEGEGDGEPFTIFVLDAGLTLDDSAQAFWSQVGVSPEPAWLDQPALGN